MPAEQDRTLRKSAPLTLPGSPHRGRRRKALDHELQLCWGTQRLGKKARTEIRELTERLEKDLPLHDGRSEFGRRVSFEDARTRAVHRWYYYKEGFSPLLIGLLHKKLAVPRGGAFLDPFAGVGTGVIAAARMDPQPFKQVYGVEYNPFSHFVGSTKLRWHKGSAARLRALEKKITDYRPARLPALADSATLKNEEIFSESRLRALREISAGIDHYVKPGAERNLLRVALAATLEPASFAKKDGRALRIVAKSERPLAPRELFRQNVGTIARDIEILSTRARARARAARTKDQISSRHIPAWIYRGDARALPSQIPSNSVSLAVYSPPYLNGIDYSEVYKVEEYFLGFLTTSRDLRDLRLGTLRSHASIRFPERESALDHIPAHATVRRLLTKIAAFVAEHEERGFQAQYAWLIPAYFDDMYRALREQARVLRPGGYAVCVVGNSMLAGDALRAIETKTVVDTKKKTNKPTKVKTEKKRYPRWQLPIATDVIIAALARAADLEVRPAYAARALVPRNVRKAWSRETVLVFRKPARRRVVRRGGRSKS